ncbi:thioredoxin domain-containing protein [Candidatus Saccharibacteria bacterium]|nr:thioredoxin domain-containing protein [Candidatus Saccharibacteria bacterium]
MNDSDYEKIGGGNGAVGVVIRVIVLVLIAIAIISLIVIGTPKSDDLNAIWDERTILGNKDAKNHYVMTTDIMCPYCDYFSRAIMSHQDEFEQWLKDNDVVYEMRITDFLNEYGEAGAKSEQAAEATLCATEEGKFWEYYHNTMTSLNEDYHSKGIGNSKTAPKIEGMTADYWLEIGYEVGLGDSFKDCYKNHSQLEHVRENTKKAAKIMEKSGTSGMPYFKFGGLETTGFDTSWGWDQVKTYYLEAGLK